MVSVVDVKARVFRSTGAASEAVGQALSSLSLKRISMTIQEARAGHSASGLSRILMCKTPSVTLSGGGFDDAHRGFFTVGKKYRVPGFLATSFSEDKAEEFLYRAHVEGEY